MEQGALQNPYTPGAGHMPPWLAGRADERRELERLLGQERILENLVLTGLRGVGKTVLLDTFAPAAIERRWLWAGTDLSESVSTSEERLALRIITDLSTVTAGFVVGEQDVAGLGFQPPVTTVKRHLDYGCLVEIYEGTPGVASDKLKAVLETVARQADHHGYRGVVLAYDEAQTLSDQAQKEEYPLALLLDVLQSLQRKGYRVLLVLAGLPTLFPNLVEARTFAERMFRVVLLDRLGEAATREAIAKPLEQVDSRVRFDAETIGEIAARSGGYPYFVQFICREAFDVLLQRSVVGDDARSVPFDAITRKLDTDFFAARWHRATDRQRELLSVFAELTRDGAELSLQEVVERSRTSLKRGFSASHANQMLAALGRAGLVYKNRHGRYSLAIPMLAQFIQRQLDSALP